VPGEYLKIEDYIAGKTKSMCFEKTNLGNTLLPNCNFF
jgi:hypothetical protein